MKLRLLFIVAVSGIFIGLVSAYVYHQKIRLQPPLYVNLSPYVHGVYATGIVESYQPTGVNINIYPDVSGKVTEVFVREGQMMKRGQSLLSLDNSVQVEIVAKDQAQVRFEQATLTNLQDQLSKIKKSYSLDSGSVSKNMLDNAVSAVHVAHESLNLAVMQYRADWALLNKYTLISPLEGIVLQIATATGSYVSSQGSYDPYTQSMLPVIQMAVISPFMQVRCFLDEILVPQLPARGKLEATLFVRGMNNSGIPLEFVSIQPYAIPHIQLSNERQERVDMRVLPILFKFKKPDNLNLFPGQLVDIYIQEKK
jgi:HlyD family secretion protein